MDRCARRLVRPDGTVLAGTAELRYFGAHEWIRLADAAGLRLVGLTSSAQPGADSAPPGPEAPDLIAILEGISR